MAAKWWARQREQNRRNVLHFTPTFMKMGIISGAGVAIMMSLGAVDAESAARPWYILGAIAGLLSTSGWWLFLRWRRHFESTRR